MTLDPRIETARGYMLMGIFYVHLVICFAQTLSNPADAVSSFVQIKLLAPHVAVFFFLSGAGARYIGKRPFQPIAVQSLMLLILAAIMQVIGYAIGPLLHWPPATWSEVAQQMIKPILLGTGHTTFVAWFFIVLAIVRVLAWGIARGWRMGLIVTAVFTALIVLGNQAVETLNLFEWRNVPIALLFFWIGSRIPRQLNIPAWAGLSALVFTLVVTWLNRPGLLTQGPCLTCEIMYVSQPTIGQYRTAPVYIVQELLFLTFLLWATQRPTPFAFNGLARYFGRYSMQALVLHGLLLAGLLPFIMKLFPARPSALLFAVLLVGSILLHAALLRLLRPVLDRLLALCFAIARAICEPPILRKPVVATS